MRVTSNTAIALDGRINTKEGRFVFLGSSRDHALMSRLRSEADAVLVGGATFRNWPRAALPDEADRHRLAGRRPWSVVVTRGLDVPLDAGFADEAGARPLVLTTARALAEARRAGKPRLDGVEIDAYAPTAAPPAPDGATPPSDGHGDEGVPVAWILDRLRARGVERLLVEGGGALLAQFVAADALDEMHVTLCPWLVGGRAPSLVDGLGFDASQLRRLQLVSAEPAGDEVFLHYRVRRDVRGLDTRPA